jgi:hypothetical protein
MKRLFKSLLLITLALGSTNTFGMKSLFEESKEAFYTSGTQHLIPSASAALTPQAMMGLTLSQAAWQTRDAESQMDESKQEIMVKDHENDPRFKLLYDLLITMPRELINLILDYVKEFEGRLVRTIPIDEHSFFLCELITISPHVIGACFLRNDFFATKTAIVDLETGEVLKAIFADTLPTKVSKNELAFNNNAHGIDITNWQTGTTTTTTIRTDENFDDPVCFHRNIAKVPDGPLMIYNKNAIEFLDLITGTKIKEINMDKPLSRAQPLSEQIIATIRSSVINLRNIHTGKEIGTIVTHSYPQKLIPLSATILAIVLEETIEIHDATIPQLLRTIETQGKLIDVTKFPTRNIIVAAIAHEGKMIIALYDPKNGECLKNFETGFKFKATDCPSIGTLICSSDTCIVAKSKHSGKREIRIWN